MFTKEDKVLFDEAVKARVAVLKRAMYSASIPAFKPIYQEEIDRYTALSVKFVEQCHETPGGSKK